MVGTQETQKLPSKLPFPPVTPQHILNTSFHNWYPKFRSLTPKARLIPLSQPFLEYLRADGILLPPEHRLPPTDAEDSGYDDEGDDDTPDPSLQWSDIHTTIASTIRELGGKVLPKLNWSAPKDAIWISATNDMECRSANDVYLLLKSSDFITHDLEHAFDGCDMKEGEVPQIPYHLVLRKSFNLNPSLEFRVFIRNRCLIAISQREMNYFDFLSDLAPKFKRLIQNFVDEKLCPENGGGFPDENFVADVYIPPPHEKVWLIDVNPWAERTDPLLFSWLELLTMEVPEMEERSHGNGDGAGNEDGREDFVRLTITSQGTCPTYLTAQQAEHLNGADTSDLDSDSDSQDEETIFDPEFRLVNRDDPEAYQFSATKYSAHKLPKDVVDASLAPGGMKDMMEEWKKVMDGQEQVTDSEGED